MSHVWYGRFLFHSDLSRLVLVSAISASIQSKEIATKQKPSDINLNILLCRLNFFIFSAEQQQK